MELSSVLLLLLQVMIAANDGLFDGPGFDSEESRLMSNCLHLLFRVLLTLFAWYVPMASSSVLFCDSCFLLLILFLLAP